MFNMGFTEMLFVAGLALILIGPKQLPELARNLGRLLNEFKRSTSIFTEELKAHTDFDRRIMREEEHQKIIKPDTQQPAAPTAETPANETKADSDKKPS